MSTEQQHTDAISWKEIDRTYGDISGVIKTVCSLGDRAIIHSSEGSPIVTGDEVEKLRSALLSKEL